MVVDVGTNRGKAAIVGRRDNTIEEADGAAMLGPVLPDLKSALTHATHDHIIQRTPDSGCTLLAAGL